MEHRKDIDGLRAIAVSLVVLFHLFREDVPGGYVGVDIFFVISGYLISTILFREADAGALSISGFYARRIRRILPALVTMLCLTGIAMAALLLPSELKALGASVTATVLFAANVYFYNHTGYFGPQADEQPFLHTWSLGVEEQFYIAFPILVMMLARLSRRSRLLVTIALATVSLLAFEALLLRNPAAAFYLPHARAWQLLSGTALALLPKPDRRSTTRDSLAMAGALALVIVVSLLSPSDMKFPGLATLAGTLSGAVLLACGGSDSLLNRIMSLRPLVILGQMSYSLYLWHWPVAVLFANSLFEATVLRLSPLGRLGPLELKTVILLISLLLAFASWRLIERPFLKRGELLPSTRAFIGAGLAVVVVLVGGGGLIVTKGWPERFDAETRRIASYLDLRGDETYRTDICYMMSASARLDQKTCLARTGRGPSALLLGDSHAAHLWYGLSRNFHGDLLQATAQRCHPLLGAKLDEKSQCWSIRQLVFGDAAAGAPADLVVLALDWDASDRQPLRDTLRLLRTRSIPVVVVGPVPHYTHRLPLLLVGARRANDERVLAAGARPYTFELERDLQSIVSAEGAVYFSMLDEMCPQTAQVRVCAAQLPDGSPVQLDRAHFTPAGSIHYTKSLANIVERVLSNRPG